jgi:hypothetical protein
LAESEVPREVRLQVTAFEVWSTVPINTSRSSTWVSPVQSTSVVKTLQVIRGFLGFCTNLLLVPLADISLGLYLRPDKLATFLAFLMARGAGKEQVIKQISVARKVADFLKAGRREDSVIFQHVTKLDAWLCKLSTQISGAMPSATPASLPVCHSVRAWADSLQGFAASMVEEDERRDGCISRRTALAVQRAVVVGLVVGSEFPPIRLDLIKTLPHPIKGPRECPDPDCMKHNCLGNRLVVVSGGTGGQDATDSDNGEEGGGGDVLHPNSGDVEDKHDPTFYAPPSGADGAAMGPGSVVFHIRHGKNDRRPSSSEYCLSFKVPESLLCRLLLAHIRYGHPILTQLSNAVGRSRLFVTGSGNAFSDATFVQYWTSAMKNTAFTFGLDYFPPSKARTVFVEAYTEQNGGMEPEFWDGASAIMGNSPKQWEKTYNPSRRQRNATSAVHSYQEFVKRQRQKAAE